jgi:hemerythrin-like domain-containing protein
VKDQEPFEPREVFNEMCQSYGIDQYAVVQPVSLDDIKKFSEEELQAIINLYIDGGFDIDEEMMELGRSGLVQFVGTEENKDLIRFRGHALLIKATKTGASKIFDRIGKNISLMSLKSIEGHASAEGDITHSSLHNTWGSINLDEFLQMDEELYQHMFNFTENGKFETHKASRIIENYGAPRLVFTTNPPDTKDVAFKDLGSGETKEGTLKDIGMEKVLYGVFQECISHLSQVSGAAFSRFALILFRPGMKPATYRETIQNGRMVEYSSIVKSLLHYTKENTTKIFVENEEWLSRPLPEYDRQIEELLKECNNSIMKNAWEGQKDAYRHIRGHALSLALIDHIHEILNGTCSNEEIIEDAQGYVDSTMERNLRSLRILVGMSKEELSDEQIRVNADRLPKQYRAFLHAYCLAFRMNEKADVLSWEQLKNVFEEIPVAARTELFGTYAKWVHFERRLNPNKTKLVFRSMFNKDIIGLSKTVVRYPKLISALECGNI